jgi:hypothetical protein
MNCRIYVPEAGAAGSPEMDVDLSEAKWKYIRQNRMGWKNQVDVPGNWEISFPIHTFFNKDVVDALGPGLCLNFALIGSGEVALHLFPIETDDIDDEGRWQNIRGVASKSLF